MAQLNKKIMAVAIAVVFCLLAAFWPHERETDTLKIEQQAVNTASEKEEAKITVYVSGAVANPGLHEIAPGSRAVEAIAAAGGMTEEANKDKVNLAKICKDGMQVNVPRLTKERRRLAAANTSASGVEAAGQNSASYNAAQESETALMGKVHLNTATAEELETLPGVGAVTAQRIVEYRSAHGFAKIEDLMNVKGIGQAKFKKMQPWLDL